MSEQILVPALGESITEATVSKWLKKPGEKVIADDLASYRAYSNSLRNAENSRINTAIFEALKSSSTIQDNRSLYY